jgi:hypothetical protein
MVYGVGLPALVRDLGAASPKLPDRDRYAAPEVLDGDPPSGRADVYSVGALLYRMLTDHEPPPPPIVSPFAGNPLLPADLEPLLIRALAIDPLERYASVEEMLLEANHALRAKRALSSRPPQRQQWRERTTGDTLVGEPRSGRSPWVAGIAGAALLAAGAGLAAFALGGSADEGLAMPTDSAPPPSAASAPVAVAVGPEAQPESANASTAIPTVALPTQLGATGDDDVEAAVGETQVEAAVEVPDEPDPLALAEAHAETVAQDPLAGDLPEVLAGPATALLEGRELARSELVPIYRYASEHADDPRASLILGDAFVELGWYTDAIDRYMSACAVDGESRHHAMVLENLIWLTFRDRHVADFAAEAIAEIYGEEAAPAVAAALASDPEGPGQRERLERLYTRIAPGE